LFPFVKNLVTQCIHFRIVQGFGPPYLVIRIWILRNQCAFSEQWKHIEKAMSARKIIYVL
jgi:hypothetical protein